MIVNGFYDWMNQKPGPSNKVYPGNSTMEAIYNHSAVAPFLLYSRLFDPSQTASWTVSFYQRDRLPDQHYRIEAKVWASGSPFANSKGPAFEFEGGWQSVGYSQPLTPWQLECAERAIRELRDYTGRDYRWKGRLARFPVLARNEGVLAEHRDAAAWPEAKAQKAKATACPSERMTSSLYPYLEGKQTEMTTAEVEAMINAKLASITARIDTLALAMASGGEEPGISVEQRIKNAEYRLKQIATIGDEGSPALERRSILQELENLRGSIVAHHHRMGGALW